MPAWRSSSRSHNATLSGLASVVISALSARPNSAEIAATIALYPEEMYRNGLTIVTCATRRCGAATLNPAVKSLNYLNNVMARIEANLAGADEALMSYRAPSTDSHVRVTAPAPLLISSVTEKAGSGAVAVDLVMSST